MASSSTSDYTISNSEGTLSAKFFHALNFTCEKFISSIKFSVFKSKYDDIYQNQPAELKSIHNEFRSALKNAISEDLTEFSKEQKMEHFLNYLENMKKSQDPNQTAWRPSGNPEEDLRDHIYSVKLKEKENLERKLAELRVINEELLNVATVNHAEIMQIKKTNDSLHEKFTNIISLFTEPSCSNFDNDISTDLRECI